MGLKLRLLGPVEAWAGGREIGLGPRKQRLVLAVLALEVNRPVGVARLVDLAWPEDPPRTATHAIRVCVSALRAAFRDVAGIDIELQGSGYALVTDPMTIDVHCFRSLLAQARGVGDDTARAALLDRALDLWSGPALAGAASPETQQRLCAGLEDTRLGALEDRLDAQLRLGRHHELAGELAGLVTVHPLRERLAGQLMLALYRDGRSGDALDAFRRYREHLAEELGLDAGAPLRQLELAILRNDEATLTPAPAAAAGPVPAQLPPAVPGFAGRAEALRDLDTLLAARPPSGTIVVIAGTAGVGKTALAVHWAHRHRDAFPDGQLYVNLRGYDPGGPALEPAEAVRGFLDAFGVPAGRIPVGLPAQSGLYRSLLAGQRVLVVLDNARDAGQVRPLLPAAPGCLAIVTSRDQLTGLVAAEGACPLTLDLFTTAEARDLLGGRLGAGRVAAEPGAVGEIITRCARLPLALAIAAARAATHPDFPLTALAAELREATTALDAFHGGDHTTDVRAVFSWSYRTLSTGAARLFRLLGLHPGSGISLPAAASLAGIPPGPTRTLLAELARAHLLTEDTPGRYGCHDLLRAFGAELAHSLDTEADRRAAVHRMLDHYLHAAHAAAIRLGPHIDTVVLAPPADRGLVIPTPPADHDAAWAWFIAEQDVLLAAIDQASAAGFDVHAWQLAWTMDTFLNRRGRWDEQASALRTATGAARRLHDPAALATTLRALASACTELGLWDEAHARGAEALRLFTEIGDPNLQAFAHLHLGSIYDRQGRPGQAIRHAQDALALYRAAGNHTGEAQALNSLGWAHACLGDYGRALTFCLQALPLLQESGDHASEAATWDSIGYAHHNLGHHQQAITGYETALGLVRTVGDQGLEAEILSHLGDTLLATASHEAARDVLHQALAIFDQLAHPGADKVRTKLHSGSPAHTR
jgi:DNA-binding SARP family transcriptional activator/tetratricopeptide (TPR) repeat protein